MTPTSEISARLMKAKEALGECGLDAILITNPKNILYLTGKDTGKALITREDAFLWVRELYRGLYSGLYSDKDYEFQVSVYEEGVIENSINSSDLKRVGVENVGISEFNGLSKVIKKELVPCGIAEKLRAIKSAYEIDLLKKSADMAKRGVKKAYSIVREGVRELDAVAEIEYEIRRLGSETPPFEDGMLLASDASSADIHAHAGTKRILSDSLVVVDLGARYRGYYSDMTRTLSVGDLGKREREILEFVENLEMETIDGIETGANASELHRFVEGKIEKRGYRFYHSTGHGVGLSVHEAPNIGPKSEDVLEEGMVFTIEPGIYIPGKFGVRFEDMVLLKKDKKEILTR
jgi:Xaa-Pro aminopeptidase